MKLFKTIGGAAFAVASLALQAQADTWDMPTPYPDATFHTVNIHDFAKDVAEKTGGKLGLATMCVGVGQGLALAIERV